MELKDTQISKTEWNNLTTKEQWEYIRILEKSDYELRQLLAINLCHVHGECIPYTRDILHAWRAENTAPAESAASDESEAR